MLLDEVDRLESADSESKIISEKYHEASTQLAVAEEKLKTQKAFDVISTGTIALGSLLFGAAFSTENTETPFWIFFYWQRTCCSWNFGQGSTGMKFELRSIVAPGDLKNERLTLRALLNVDVGDYLVAQTLFIDGSPSTNLKYMLWFPFKQISRGDLVVVYTKTGANKERALSKGNIAHFFYLDRIDPIWSDPTIGAIILHTASWQSKSLEELKPIDK